ncbi:disease resistance protein RPV1-like [Prosopis cineraria]|uniref:disease resistance protein RPV1-like n=1 Tax=Prosopis cineraria TaxID=364024 RepID=UPI00240FBAF7|nr:disease resistance protein RPV1-like [Prosopis cineraria]
MVLDELAHIIWCKEEKNQLVTPIFYKVYAMDVQFQRNSFGEAMAAHEAGRFRDGLEKVRKWRSALFEAASLSSAWLFEDGHEFGFIERIVEDVYAMLPPKPFHSIEHSILHDLIGRCSTIHIFFLSLVILPISYYDHQRLWALYKGAWLS